MSVMMRSHSTAREKLKPPHLRENAPMLMAVSFLVEFVAYWGGLPPPPGHLKLMHIKNSDQGVAAYCHPIPPSAQEPYIWHCEAARERNILYNVRLPDQGNSLAEEIWSCALPLLSVQGQLDLVKAHHSRR